MRNATAVAVAREGAARGSVTRDRRAAKQDVVLRRGLLFLQAAMKSIAGHTVEEDNGREHASWVDVATFFEYDGLSLGQKGDLTSHPVNNLGSFTSYNHNAHELEHMIGLCPCQDKQEAMIEFL